MPDISTEKVIPAMDLADILRRLSMSLKGRLWKNSTISSFLDDGRQSSSMTTLQIRSLEDQIEKLSSHLVGYESRLKGIENTAATLLSTLTKFIESSPANQAVINSVLTPQLSEGSNLPISGYPPMRHGLNPPTGNTYNNFAVSAPNSILSRERSSSTSASSKDSESQDSVSNSIRSKNRSNKFVTQQSFPSDVSSDIKNGYLMDSHANNSVQCKQTIPSPCAMSHQTV